MARQRQAKYAATVGTQLLAKIHVLHEKMICLDQHQDHPINRLDKPADFVGEATDHVGRVVDELNRCIDMQDVQIDQLANMVNDLVGTVIYSSTGTAYEGGSEGKTEKGGSLVVQGQKDSSSGTRRDTGEMRRESPKEIPDSGDLGSARGAVTRSAKVKRYRGRHTAHTTHRDERDY